MLDTHLYLTYFTLSNKRHCSRFTEQNKCHVLLSFSSMLQNQGFNRFTIFLIAIIFLTTALILCSHQGSCWVYWLITGSELCSCSAGWRWLKRLIRFIVTNIFVLIFPWFTVANSVFSLTQRRVSMLTTASMLCMNVMDMWEANQPVTNSSLWPVSQGHL